MANDPKKPQYGALAVDATDLEDKLVDLDERGRVGMQSEQPGCDLAEAEIEANHDEYSQRGGITALTMEELRASQESVKKIRSRLHAARKLVEILEESEAFHDDRRQRLMHTIARSVEMQAKARGDRELLAKYERTRAYRSSIANKGVRTRLRNQQAADAPVDALAETLPAE